jgi:hypothetical protein
VFGQEEEEEEEEEEGVKLELSYRKEHKQAEK